MEENEKNFEPIKLRFNELFKRFLDVNNVPLIPSQGGGWEFPGSFFIMLRIDKKNKKVLQISETLFDEPKGFGFRIRKLDFRNTDLHIDEKIDEVDFLDIEFTDCDLNVKEIYEIYYKWFFTDISNKAMDRFLLKSPMYRYSRWDVYRGYIKYYYYHIPTIFKNIFNFLKRLGSSHKP